LSAYFIVAVFDALYANLDDELMIMMN